jgi:hypothetical protein
MESEPARHLRPVSNPPPGPVIGSCPFRTLDGQVCNRDVRRRNLVGAPPKYCDDPTHNARNARQNEEKIAAAQAGNEEAAPMTPPAPQPATILEPDRLTETTVRLEESERARLRAENQLDRANEQIAELRDRIERLHEAHSASLLQMHHSSEENLQRAQQGHDEAVQEILDKHRVEIASERDRCTRAIESERLKHANDARALREQVEEAREELRAAQQSLALQSARWSSFGGGLWSDPPSLSS